ncbi:MAG: hypothetical protein NUV54_02400 [Candidatus Taylorbacteria bacterium]|nr:hypothetical protein [Candidatus Taylorbacteria bacterium]
MKKKFIRLIVSRTKDELVKNGRLREYFATTIVEDVLYFDSASNPEHENVVTAWTDTLEGEQEKKLRQLKCLVRRVIKNKGISKVQWMHNNRTWRM